MPYDPNARNKAGRKNKYNNRKTTVDGITFDSAKEANRYGELKLLELAGEIQNLELQKRFSIKVAGVHVCDYIADFVYSELLKVNNRPAIPETVVEDAKGMRTAVYKIKRKLMLAVHGIKIRET